MFSFIFIIEVVIKLIGMGWKGMCQSYRNCYDLLITTLSIPWARVSQLSVTVKLTLGDPDKLFMYFISFTKEELTGKTYTYGVILILMRFFSICGKHVSTLFLSYWHLLNAT